MTLTSFRLWSQEFVLCRVCWLLSMLRALVRYSHVIVEMPHLCVAAQVAEWSGCLFGLVLVTCGVLALGVTNRERESRLKNGERLSSHFERYP